MAEPLHILVGTMTSTADYVAQEIEPVLAGLGYRPQIRMMDAADVSCFDEKGVFLICTSTYGNGDVPDNAQALLTALETDRPNLSHVIFGVIALGDRTYGRTFCGGGEHFNRVLTGLGARRAGDMLKLDASSGQMPEDIACEWAADWATNALAAHFEPA